ncbi:MAG TPA: hypothetical protein VMI75_32245 [Polyangiaceae bacterium]|nr:hypothetical protein [Polyangiaceae bacterium]
MTSVAIKDLDCTAIDAKPIDFDWSEGYGETWECWEGSRCSECNAALVGREGDRHCDVDNESECRGTLSGEGPMMNYYYPCTIGDEAEAARTLADTCLCVVRVNGETGLALTGGGMDLSWEIKCEAFMLLGHLPPVHFADLPGMAGKDVDSKRNRWIVAGCLKSCRVAASWAQGRASRLRATVASMRKRAAERAKGAA